MLFIVGVFCVFCLQVFSIVVFATITAEGYINHYTTQEIKCMFNENDGACNYGVGIGVIAFLACVIMLIIDANFPQISNAQQRKIIVVGDLVFSGESPCFTSCSAQRNSTRKQEVSCEPCFHLMHVCFIVFIAGQRCGRSCGSSVSVSWPTSGPIPRLSFLYHMMPLGPLWLLPSSQFPAG